MKRLLVLLFCLVAIGAFAQAPAAPGLVWSGYLCTGGLVQTFNGATPQLGIWDPADITKSRLNLQMKYDGGSYGLYVRIREDDNWFQNLNVNPTLNKSIPTTPTATVINTGGTNAIGFRRAYGWMDALNGMVRISAGRLNTYAWATGSGGGSFNSFGNDDGAVGMDIQIKPIDGLNIGAFVPFSDQMAPNTPLDTLSNALNSSFIAASYYLKGVGDIEGGYWFSPNNITTYTTAAGNPSSNFFVYPYAWFGFAYTGMPALTAYVESRISTAANTTANYSYFDEVVGYNMAPLHFQVLAEELINGFSSTGLDMHFQASADYTVGIANIGVFGDFTSTTAPATGTGWDVGPWIQLNLAKNCYVKLWGQFGGGTVVPQPPGSPWQDFPGDFGGTYTQLAAPWSAMADSTYVQAYLQLVFNF